MNHFIRPPKVIFLLISAIFLSGNFALALTLPLPPNSKVVREEIAEAGGQDKKVTFCESELNEEKVSSFYQRELEKRGYGIFMQQPSMKIYTKGDDLFMLILSSDKQKTTFILTEAKTGQAAAANMLQACEDIPSVAVYPGAQCMGSMRLKSSGAVSVKYSSSKDLEEVLSFYRLQMPVSGWKLEKETDMGKFFANQQPSGAAGMGMNLQGATMLLFEGLKNERCIITLMPMPMGRGTLISIMYEEKK